ncbi:MAG: hypothetical protein M3T56_18205 [Chloroflexota bacterium]|nr:hypothetical protein [Chloroflexota bacterium]
MSEPTTDQPIAEAPRSDASNWAKPVRTLTTKDVPKGAQDLNVTGRRLAGAATGFGRLWQKSFSVRLEGATVTPREVIKVWKEKFGDFWPKGQRMFLPATGIAPGEVGLINAKPMPGVPSMATGVLVIYADDESFSFMTPEGHPFAGPLTFSAADDGGVTVVKVDELTRASDPFWELTMMIPLVGARMQNDIWRKTLGNVAKHFGVDAQVEERIVCVDRRRQWSNAKNIWQNAGIRSAFYAFGAPVRKLRPRR